MANNRNSRGSSGGRSRRRRRATKAYRTPKDLAQCPICKQNIRDVLTAIIISEDGTAAHFDCIVKKLARDEELRGKDKICYLGSGEFGVVRFPSADPSKFSIQKRIKFELKEHLPEWRKQISKDVSR